MSIERVNERFKDFKNAFIRLSEASKLDNKNDIVVDAVIQRFEFTFELAWKLMKSYLEYQGISDIQSPRGAMKSLPGRYTTIYCPTTSNYFKS